MSSDLAFWLVLIVFAIALQFAALSLRKRYDPEPAPRSVLQPFLLAAWLLTWALIAALDVAARAFDLTAPMVIALLPVSVLSLWYWARYQAQILPSSPHYLPRCPHCNRRNPSTRTACQWCHKPMQRGA